MSTGKKTFRRGTLVLALGCAASLSFAEDVAQRRARALAPATIAAILNAEPTAIARVREDLDAVLADNPRDALARVHRGWLRVLEAREMSPREARAAAERGFEEMDTAVQLAPDDAHVRLVRARCAYQVPRVLGREAQARNDFRWLIAGATRSDGENPWPASLRREILLHAGSFALKERRAREAITLFEIALAIPSDFPGDEEIQSMLALARGELSSHVHGEDPHAHEGEGPAAAP